MAKSKAVAHPDLRAKQILARLKTEYADAVCSLEFGNPLQLLIATILSAQCTDERVNKVTPELFKRYPDASSFADADIQELEELVKSTGFYRNKAKNIQACCQKIRDQHRGQVPQTMDELSALPGVGRKTANVVLGNAFGIPGLVVDTHVTRLSNRMGLAKGEDAVKLEAQLEKVVPRKDWVEFSHWMIAHGRAVCNARKAACETCFIRDLCPKLGTDSGVIRKSSLKPKAARPQAAKHLVKAKRLTKLK